MSWFRKTETVAPRRAPRAVAAEPTTLPALPEAVGGVGHLDVVSTQDEFTDVELEVAARVAARVEKEDLRLPHLPATHLRLMDLVGNPECDIGEVARVISEDVVLTATLLRTANSVMFGGTREIDSVRGAVSRIGLRGLRSTLYMQSLKSVMYRPPGLAGHADEVWRQSCASALFARTLATFTSRDPERSFVLGLLHDVGRIPILRVIAEEMKGKAPRHELVRRILQVGHESVGAQLAERWNLPAELTAVCGNHHGDGGALAAVVLDLLDDQVTSPGESSDPAPTSALPASDHREAVGLVRIADRIDMALHAADQDQVAAILADTEAAAIAGLRSDRLHAAVAACIRAWSSWTAQTAAA